MQLLSILEEGRPLLSHCQILLILAFLARLTIRQDYTSTLYFLDSSEGGGSPNRIDTLLLKAFDSFPKTLHQLFLSSFVPQAKK